MVLKVGAQGAPHHLKRDQNAGLYLAPTRCEETLHTNLLSLESCPPDIFIAETECRKPRGREVFSSCTSNRSTSPDFVPGQFGFAARFPIPAKLCVVCGS